MSLSTAARQLLQELNTLLNRKVTVKLVGGGQYTGVLKGFDHPHMNVVLDNAVDGKGNKYVKVVVRGTVISEILAEELPLFDPEEFAKYVINKLNLHPGDAKVLPEVGKVVFLGRITVSENGVEGSGLMAEKIHSLLQKYLEEKKAQRKG